MDLAAFLTPPLLYTLSLVLFVLLIRSPWPWTRIGGVVLLVTTAGCLALILAEPVRRALLLTADRLPLVLLVVGSLAVLWASLHRLLHGSRAAEDEAPAWEGFGTADFAGGGLAVLAVAVAATFLGAPVGDPAGETGELPWFLLGLEALAPCFTPGVAILALPLFGLTGLLALPFLDSSPTAEATPAEDFEGRRQIVVLFLFAWFFLILLPMILGALGGVGAASGRALSELVWTSPPASPLLREMPGLVLLVLYLVVLPWRLPRLRATRGLVERYRRKLGTPRLNVALLLSLLIVLVPLKLYALWLFGIVRIVDLPEIGLGL